MPKILLFVLRDFDHTHDDIDSVSKSIKDDIFKLWNEVKKPDNFAKVTADHFFHVMFYPLPHFRYQYNDFKSYCYGLRERLINPANPCFIFKNTDTEKNIPYDGLYLYLEKVWAQVKDNKDVNLPTQKILVSNMRCDDEAKKTYEDSKEYISQIKKMVQQGYKNDLKDKIDSQLRYSISQYKKSTSAYDEQVASAKETEMISNFIESFDQIIKLQLKNSRTELQTSFSERLREITQNDMRLFWLHVLNFLNLFIIYHFL